MPRHPGYAEGTPIGVLCCIASREIGRGGTPTGVHLVVRLVRQGRPHLSSEEGAGEGGGVIGAGDERKLLAARLVEDLSPIDAHFLKRLQAVCDK